MGFPLRRFEYFARDVFAVFEKSRFRIGRLQFSVAANDILALDISNLLAN